MKLFRKPEFHIYEAAVHEYEMLSAIHSLSFSHGWQADEIAATLSTRGTRCLVINIRGQGKSGPKGFLIFRSLAGQSEVLTIAIKPEFRGKGLARALMDNAIRKLRKEHVEQFFLEVSENNAAALGLYKSLHFKQISLRKAYYDNDGQTQNEISSQASAPKKPVSQRVNALVMQLELV